MMVASKIDFLLDVYGDRLLNPEGYNIKVKEKIKKLYSLLDKIKPISDDEYKVLYFSVEKGNIEEYGDYEELKEYGEVSSYEDFERRFNEDYPDDIYWYKMVTSRYKNYYAISINSKNIIYANMDEEKCFEDYQLQELIDFLIIKVDEIIKKLKDGTYNDYISNNYSYKNRFGVIKRSDYWKLYPDAKESLLNEISENEIDYFVKNANNKTDKRIKKMTSGKYFKCVRLAYENNNYEIGDLSDKELYLKYADGRDEGLSNISIDSPSEFDAWYNNDTKYGGHPWEIIRGHSFARVNLYINHDDNGYYLDLDGTKILRKIEIARIFIALSKNNIPVQIYSIDTLKNAFLGNDYIGVVPYYVLPIECGGYFKKYKPTEFTHLEDGMFKYLKWEPLEKVELK